MVSSDDGNRIASATAKSEKRREIFVPFPRLILFEDDEIQFVCQVNQVFTMRTYTRHRREKIRQ